MQKTDINSIAEFLYGDWGTYRKLIRSELNKSGYARDLGVSLKNHRKAVFKQLRMLSKHRAVLAGFPAALGGDNSPGAGVAVFEELVLRDPSLQIKYGVHYGLFGSAILNLGTVEQQQKFLPKAISMDTPGVFAMTETGHGSDVANIKTTAVYDEKEECFTINTPDRSAWKDYLGNAAWHGKAAVVFAQLYVNGQNEGVHAFYVPLRHKFGRLYKGIKVEDDGAKGGLNGIDNGRLSFSNVVIPRANLLGKFGAVQPSGEYVSPIESPHRRFFTMLSTLVQGRVSLVGAVINAQKLSLAVGIPYAFRRTQFKDSHGIERRLIDYPLHQSRVIPPLIETYALSCMHQDLLSKFDTLFSQASPLDREREELETYAAAAKAYATWAALKNIQIMREACGGQGYLAENQIVHLRADLDVYATFEGDNNVLLQLAAKRLLGDFGREWKSLSLGNKIKTASRRWAQRQAYRAGLIVAYQDMSDMVGVASGAERMLATDMLGKALACRIEIMTEELAQEFAASSDKEAVLMRNQKSLIDLALAEVQFRTWLIMRDRIQEAQELTPEAKDSLNTLMYAYGFQQIVENAEWHISYGSLSKARIASIHQYLSDELYPSISAEALDLVEAFDLKDLVSAPIANYKL